MTSFNEQDGHEPRGTLLMCEREFAKLSRVLTDVTQSHLGP